MGQYSHSERDGHLLVVTHSSGSSAKRSNSADSSSFAIGWQAL